MDDFLSTEQFVANVADWLKDRLIRSSLPITEAMLFGSVLRKGSACGDVDLAIRFGARSRSDLLKDAQWLAKLGADFRRIFRKDLHITKFLPKEQRYFLEFQERAGDRMAVVAPTKLARRIMEDGARPSSFTS